MCPSMEIDGYDLVIGDGYPWPGCLRRVPNGLLYLHAFRSHFIKTYHENPFLQGVNSTYLPSALNRCNGEAFSSTLFSSFSVLRQLGTRSFNTSGNLLLTVEVEC